MFRRADVQVGSFDTFKPIIIKSIGFRQTYIWAYILLNKDDKA